MIEMYRTTRTHYGMALTAAREFSERIAGATSKIEDMPADARYFLSWDLRSGYGITKEGTLIGVFSIERGRGHDMIKDAISKGADNLDCFDGFLPGYYQKFGFRETHREANWTEGEPDVVFMALQV
ncbi:acetyltransferase [Streptomyces phage Celia]|uniref:Acetyltransferase n=1 Tax=Streptomyces phage Celia TaxID=2590946 RepID=A0A516KRF2_9CAUD|nr:acetyltransferase [Streptomyces phage Celia]QDP44281.1 acetyltransferase [Streptomyces phage Celia]QFG10543.1 acetyltransferase [Streptomyces phage Urza]QJD50646.1 acetyltransferase [Streptomyces phage Itza]